MLNLSLYGEPSGMSEELEQLKKDLIHQLSFEDIDWDYFNETVECAIETDGAWQEILINENRSGALDQTYAALEEYRKIINRIDDFFEYANQSVTDRKFIQEQLNNLSQRLLKIYRTK